MHKINNANDNVLHNQIAAEWNPQVGEKYY